VRDIRVQSWSELNECLYAHSWNPALKRFRSRYAFRGQPFAEDLCSGLIRMGGATERIEGAMLRTFIKYARREGEYESIWDWLAVAQHHGLPTRLVDWTFSPFVALHFATNTVHARGDAVVWCVDYAATHRLLPRRLRELLEAEDAEVFTADMFARVAGSLRAFDRLTKTPLVAFFEPPSLDQRIVNQSALFSLMSSPTARLDAWLNQHPELSRRVVIPWRLRCEIRDKLDQANVTERVLFPGLDGLSAYLRRYYGPSPILDTAEEPQADLHSEPGVLPEESGARRLPSAALRRRSGPPKRTPARERNPTVSDR
jgi:hypothetical protein